MAKDKKKRAVYFNFSVLCLFSSLLLLLVINTHYLNSAEKIFNFVIAEDFIKKYYKNEINIIPLSLETKSLPDWMLSNIRHELQNFEPFSAEDLEKYFFESNPSNETLIHYRIRNGILYFRSNDTGWPSPTAEYTMALYKILSQPSFKIETGDFLLNTSDGVQHRKANYPILCFSKHQDSNYVLVPDWFAIWKDRLILMPEIDKAIEAFPWDKKIEKAFWIGAANGNGFELAENWKDNRRAKLVLFSLDNPDYIWAKFTHIKNEQHICPEMKELDPLLCAERISPFEACKHKYLIDVDGFSSAFHRCQWILRSNCVSIKENSGNLQWYYFGLKPYVHYVPYQTDCSDLLNIISWLMGNDEKAKEIAMEGQKFALQYLDHNTTYLYLYHVLNELNKLNSSTNNTELGLTVY